MKKLKVAVVGLGWVSTHRHIPSILESKKYKLIGVVDRNPGKVDYWASRLGVLKSTATSLAQVDWIDQVEAIDIATAPMDHFNWIADGIAADKHVICEKPFVLEEAQWQKIKILSQKSRSCIAVVHNFQFSSSVKSLERDINCGKLGSIHSVNAMQWGNPSRRLPSWHNILPMGLFFDESPHLLYLLKKFSETPLELKNTFSMGAMPGKNTPDCVSAIYAGRHSGREVPYSLSCNFSSSVSEWYFSVHGSSGVGIVDIFRDIYIYLPNDGAHTTSSVMLTSIRATAAHWIQCFKNGPKHLMGKMRYGNDEVFLRFANAVINNDVPKGISLDDALEVNAMQLQINKHYEESRHAKKNSDL